MIRHGIKDIIRSEAARQLELLAAGLRSGVLDIDDVHARIPDRVKLHLTVKDDAVELTISWQPSLLAAIEGQSGEALLNIADHSATLQAEARAAEEVKSADDAVVRAAREGRMP